MLVLVTCDVCYNPNQLNSIECHYCDNFLIGKELQIQAELNEGVVELIQYFVIHNPHMDDNYASSVEKKVSDYLYPMIDNHQEDKPNPKINEKSKSSNRNTDKKPYFIDKIFGPPGTGKTTTLINLIKSHIEKGISPNDIGFFSFTNFSTNVAKKRIIENFPNYNIDKDFNGFRTIHSLAYQTLQSNYNLLNKEQALEFSSEFRFETRYLEFNNEASIVIRGKHPVIDEFAIARAKMISFEEHSKQLSDDSLSNYFLNKWLRYPKDRMRKVFEYDLKKLTVYNQKYEDYKSKIGVIDYTSILEKGLEQEKSIPSFKLIFIDEAQDLSNLQWAFIEKVFKKSDKVYIAGDDDQTICESFGATAKKFINIKSNKETVLNYSYRIPTTIHKNIKSNVIPNLNKKYPYRKKKNWEPNNSSFPGLYGSLKIESILDLVSKFPNKEWLVLTPTHKSKNLFSEILMKNNISHILSNKIVSFSNDSKYLPSINLFTIWEAKGDEADISLLYLENSTDLEMIDKDPRLKYVAVTRGKNIQINYGFGKVINNYKDFYTAISKLKDKRILNENFGRNRDFV